MNSRRSNRGVIEPPPPVASNTDCSSSTTFPGIARPVYTSGVLRTRLAALLRPVRNRLTMSARDANSMCSTELRADDVIANHLANEPVRHELGLHDHLSADS